MKISLNWINNYTNISQTLEKETIKNIAHTYSIKTAEIDDIFEYNGIGWIVIAKVLESLPHPDSDHLNVVKVTDWDNEYTVVCWAPNVSKSKYVPFAKVWTKLSPDFIIWKRKLRWVDSEWMICSLDELWLISERQEWIFRLENEFSEEILESKLWTDFFELNFKVPFWEYKLKDTVFEIDNKFITNRPDLFWVIWNAREFSVVFNSEFKNKNFKLKSFTNIDKNNLNLNIKEKEKKIRKFLNIKIQTNKVLSIAYKSIKNIKVIDTKLWIKTLLFRSGINSKNALIDMSNYTMIDTWKPNHAYDSDKIKWNIRIIELDKETAFKALDANDYTLPVWSVVVVDDEKIIGTPVIWAMCSAIDDNTSNILLEAWVFDAVTVRKMSQSMWVRTDASTRYEKAQDPLSVINTLEKAVETLNFLYDTEFEISSEFNYIDIKSLKKENNKIKVNHKFIEKKIWVKIKSSFILETLEKLWFKIKVSHILLTKVSKTEKKYSIKIPSWRATKDVSIKEDIVEEISRILGYDDLPSTPIEWDFEIAEKNVDLKNRDKIVDYFRHNKFLELYNYSFTSEEKLTKLLWDKAIKEINLIKVLNSLTRDFTVMRPNLISWILEKLSENRRRDINISFFEIWKIFSNSDKAYSEKVSLAWAVTNTNINNFKKVLDWLVSIISKDYTANQNTNLDYLHPNASWEYLVWNDVIINFWKIHPKTSSIYWINPDTYIFEADLVKILEIMQEYKSVYSALPTFPSIPREIAFIMDSKKPIWDVMNLIKGTSNIIESIEVLSVFEDEAKLWANKKSVAFKLVLQDTKTLTDTDALNVQKTVIANLDKEDIKLR